MAPLCLSHPGHCGLAFGGLLGVSAVCPSPCRPVRQRTLGKADVLPQPHNRRWVVAPTPLGGSAGGRLFLSAGLRLLFDVPHRLLPGEEEVHRRHCNRRGRGLRRRLLGGEGRVPVGRGGALAITYYFCRAPAQRPIWGVGVFLPVGRGAGASRYPPRLHGVWRDYVCPLRALLHTRHIIQRSASLQGRARGCCGNCLRLEKRPGSRPQRRSSLLGLFYTWRALLQERYYPPPPPP